MMIDLPLMTWIENRVIDRALAPGQVLIGVGYISPETDSLLLADINRFVSQDKPQRPAQNKDVFLHTVIMLVRGMAAIRVKFDVICADQTCAGKDSQKGAPGSGRLRCGRERMSIAESYIFSRG